jgi:general nucleoside transport system ATP-binding protein
MRVLAGFYRPDSGYIEIDGRRVDFHNPKEAKLAGIGMVHQHFSLVPALTVSENLALGATSTPFFLKPRRWTKHLIKSAQRLGIGIRPDVYVWQLSMGERQRVEVFRLVLEGARILILDEPTSILAPQEAEHLFHHLRKFAELGHVILLITHKIDHVKAITDQVTILRHGRLVATSKTQDLSETELAELMVGRAFQKRLFGRAAGNTSDGKTILEVRNLTVKPLACPTGLTDLSFTLQSGEILGVAGISSNGQDELVAALTGTAKYDGVIELACGKSANHTGNCLGYIPSDRVGIGVALSLSVQDNLSLRDYTRPPFSFGPLLQKSQLEASARQKIAAFGIRPGNPGCKTSQLSGGNIQKIILARELANRPHLIIAVSPTAGLDIATADFVHREIARQAEEGTGILIVSEDLDELLSLCDRILVLYASRLVGAVDARPDRRNDIGLMMSGSFRTNGRS